MKIIVPGKPVPQPRARHFGRGRPRSDSDRSAAHKELIRAMFLAHGGWNVRSIRPIRLVVDAYFGVSGLEDFGPFLGTPDWDNVGKLVSDALNGLAYRDDRQVCEATVRKIAGPKDCDQTIITLEEL